MISDEELIELCRASLRIPSFSGKEGDVARFFQKKMGEFGFDEVVIDRYGSVLGTVTGKQPGRTILFDGHIDNVDVIDEALWTHGPFSGDIADGKIYGRGASDMKGNDCSLLVGVARFIEETGKNFAGKICVSLTVHEECFEGVSSRNIVKLCKPDWVVICEATSTTVKIGQRGRAEVVVETTGKSCHSSNPEKGVNAVYHMMAVIEEIRKIKPNVHPLLGKGILELTDIKSFPYPGSSVLPSLCTATFDRRTLVGEDESVILGQVEQAIADAKKKIPELNAKVYIREGEALCWTGDTIKSKRYFPAWTTDENHELVQRALQGLRKAGVDAELSHFSFCTNGSCHAGEENIPTIGYGPSLESLAHIRDEYIEISQLVKAANGYQQILRELTR